MSFLERLRQNPPSQKLTESQLAEIARFEQEVAEGERQRLHAQQKSRAENFCSASGIIPMVKSVGYLIAGNFHTIVCCEQHGIHRSTAYLLGGGISLDEVSSFQPVDKDGALCMMRWDDREGRHNRSRRDLNVYAEMMSKYFVIEMQPDGVLKIHAGRGGSSILHETMWRDNEDVLDGALEKAYNHPGTYKWQKWVRGASFT